MKSTLSRVAVAIERGFIVLVLTCAPALAFAGPNAGVERQVREYFKDAPVMVKIAKCESGFMHFDPRNPHKLRENPDPRSSASGVFQILLKTHGKTARKLGFDITTVKGQLGYAEHLYEQNGTRDWNASRHCWG